MDGKHCASATALAVALLVLTCLTVFAAPVQWRVEDGGNNHFYDIVLKDIDYQSARAEAASLSFLSVPGYLATPAMSDEAIFIWNNVTVPATQENLVFWLGAEVALEHFGDVSEYYWVTGEQALASEQTEWYIDWYEGNSAYALAQIPHSWWTAGWRCQDIYQTYIAQGYVVEYPTVPEPASLAVLAAGLPLAALLRRR